MTNRFVLPLLVLACVLSSPLPSPRAVAKGAGPAVEPQDANRGKPVLRVEVNLVLLNVAVTDNKGHYVTGLRPSDFAISEDNIPQKIASFGEGNGPQRTVEPAGEDNGSPRTADSATETSSTLAGANVFVLFDTSNYMYRGFALAQDAIADFVRSLDSPERVAFYAYSRNLYRGAVLTADRAQVLRGVRSTVAGDEPALYNALLLTLRDAGQFPGRKVLVIFSNGPDESSMVTPEDIGELAQSEGIPIYVVSTQQAALDPVSIGVFRQMSAATGGQAYFSKNWRDEQKAFDSIRNDVAHLYGLSYYPQPNPNRGWRTIKVKLVGEAAKKYHVRTRNGYRPQAAHFSKETTPLADTPSPN
jgi:Ca-activated chloride channel family protein